MKRLAIAVGVVAVAGLLGWAAVWACCGGGIVISIGEVVDTPDPVPCKATTNIGFNVYLEMEDWGDVDPYNVMAQVDIKDGATIIATLGPKRIGFFNWEQQNSPIPASFSWTPGVPGGNTYTYAITAWTQDDAGNKSLEKYLPEAGTITTVHCCVEGISLEVTPQTFDVTRAGVPVKAHVVLPPPPWSSVLSGGTIIEIGGIATSIPGTASPDSNLTFSSAAFSAVAKLIVPAGKPRAEDVPVLIHVDLVDPDAQPCERYYTDTIDIINEGKTKK